MRQRRTLIMTVGLPCSGKSTWARRSGYPVVSSDAVRLALHGRTWYAPAEPVVWAHVRVMVRALFEAGHDTVVLDATSLTNHARNRWRDDDWDVVFVEFNRSLEDCLECARVERDPEMQDIIPMLARSREPLPHDATVISPLISFDLVPY